MAQPPPSDTPPDPSVGERYDGQIEPERRSDWRDGLLWVPRVILYPIRLIFRGLWFPVRQGLEYDERHQVSQRVVDAFTSDDGLLGLRVAFAYTTGFRPTAGLSFFDLKLLGPDTAFRVAVTGAGDDLFHGAGRQTGVGIDEYYRRRRPI